MWMMGYNDGFDNMNMSNSFNRRNLLPQLFPKPALSITNNTLTTPQACFSQFQPLAVAEQNKLRDELNTQQPQVVVSSRWNPTPEQLRALEELYRRGIRTPSADQIQNITAKLRRFGKVEGKNVFYWFQNHKARERQKRRRQIMESKPQDQQQEIIISEKKELLGTSMAILDEGQEQITKNVWVPSKNCTTLTEEYNDVSTQRVPKAGAESNRTDMLIHFGKLRDQLKNRRNSFMAKNSTWQMIHLSCPPPSASTNNNNTHHLIINAPSTTTTTTTVRRTMTHDLIDLFNITPNFPQNHGFKYHEDHDQDLNFNNGGDSDDQTLELFPLRSCGSGTLNEKDSNGGVINATASHPQQFFEFLPLKN